MSLPFATLTPDTILTALESLGLRPDGRLLALNSYENRVYQVWMEEGPPLVAKFYRPKRWSLEAILEEHDFALELSEREIPVVAPARIGGQTLHHYGDFHFAVFAKHGGRAPELEDTQTLRWIGRFLGRLHAVGAVRPFRHRPVLDAESFGDQARDYVLSTSFLAPELREVYAGVSAQALAGVRQCYARAGAVQGIRLHGDCHAGNILWTDAGPHFVDLDDARMGPAVQDLWMLLSGEREERARQLGDVLSGYEDFHAFDERELHLIEALRTLRLMHYAAWIAQRWDDPAFPVAFPWFDTPRYWQDRILELREQIALMDEPPLWST